LIIGGLNEIARQGGVVGEIALTKEDSLRLSKKESARAKIGDMENKGITTLAGPIPKAEKRNT